ncbi:MAG: cysteine desulfurase [Oscillospiraceae bacterium]|nr:cysteine desulfurase [Oscillospiraceae bacterium]
MEIYLDNSATTQTCAAAADEAAKMMTMSYGNPSSQHKLGIEALGHLNKARERIATVLSCSDDEIFFTPSGTIANNTAIFGAAALNKRKGNTIVTTTIEHPSVLQPIGQLEAQGAQVIRLQVDRSGNISEEELFRAVNKNTILVSIMAVNNEIGSINPVHLVQTAVKRSGSPALIHCDAVQAFGKIKLKPAQMGIDLMSVSSHKIHGPKGAGALYVRKGLNLPPYIYGGGQEKGLVSGTEALPAIAGFGAAAAALPDVGMEQVKLSYLREHFLTQIASMPGVTVNSPINALPYIINISVLGVPSEVLINYLSSFEIYISAGSACKRGRKSEVIRMMGLSSQRADSAVRISLSRFTTRDELDRLAEKINEAIVKFRR